MHGRMYINLLQGEKTLIGGMLYARYLLEVKLGRRLKDGCEVDHIDGFPWNDSLSNLQELPARLNSSKGRATLFKELQHAKYYIMIKCPACGNWFERKKSCRPGKLTFCSNRCSSKFNRFTGDRSKIQVETRAIEPPSLEGIPLPYHEPFEQYSLPRFKNKTVYLCACGNQLPTLASRYCSECRRKYVKKMNYHDTASDIAAMKDEIIEAIRDEYAMNGKIAMWRFCKRFGLSDRGLAKRMNALFGKPYKEVIADICNGNYIFSPGR